MKNLLLLIVGLSLVSLGLLLHVVMNKPYVGFPLLVAGVILLFFNFISQIKNLQEISSLKKKQSKGSEK